MVKKLGKMLGEVFTDALTQIRDCPTRNVPTRKNLYQIIIITSLKATYLCTIVVLLYLYYCTTIFVLLFYYCCTIFVLYLYYICAIFVHYPALGGTTSPKPTSFAAFRNLCFLLLRLFLLFDFLSLARLQIT